MSEYFYSPNGGFLVSGIHEIPAGAIALTDDEYADLRNKQAAGHTITASEDGKPTAILDEVTKEVVERRRAVAYADPVTGSDRLYSEALRLQLSGDESYQAAITAAKARYDEIREANPWP